MKIKKPIRIKKNEDSETIVIHPLVFVVLGVMMFFGGTAAFNHIDPWLGIFMFLVSLVMIGFGLNDLLSNNNN